MIHKTLAEGFPDIAAEWDYEENGALTPDRVAAHSNRKVSWICKLGHRWTAQVNSRTRPNGTGCPVCAGKKILAGFNDLETLRPDIAAEWDYENNGTLLPSQVGLGSNRSVAWICEKKHQWSAMISNRTGVSGSSRNGSGCPICTGKAVNPGENDLATLYPELLSEWDYEKNNPLLPTQVRPASNRKVSWKCSFCGYEWDAKIEDRVIKGYGCPMCSNKRTHSGINDLVTEYPDIAKDWDYSKNDTANPHELRPQSNLKVFWKCHICNGEWEARVADYVAGKAKCPYCSGKKALKGKTDLETCFPEIASEWNFTKNGDMIPSEFLPNSAQRIHWKCNKCGYEWSARITDRVRTGTKCPCCAGKKAIKGVTDLSTKYPYIAKQWDYENNGDETPDDVLPSSNKKYSWKCDICGQTWITSVYTRTSKNTGCPFCAGRKPIKGKNDFATLHPELLCEWDFHQNTKLPEEITEKSNYRANWICAKGHTWSATVKSRVLTGCGCPKCAGKVPIVGETDLATLRPDLAAQWNFEANKFGPEEVTVSSGKNVFWRCENGHEWQERIITRSQRDGLCPTCSKKRRSFRGPSF